MKKVMSFVSAFLLAFAVHGQSKKLVGIWEMVSLESVAADGSISYPYGKSPAGQLIFMTDGTYAIQILKTGRPAISSGNKSAATPEENAMMVQGNNSHFGTYVYNKTDSSVTYRVVHAFFPNWEGTELKAKIILEKDLLKSQSSSTTFGSSKALITWRRKK